MRWLQALAAYDTVSPVEMDVGSSEIAMLADDWRASAYDAAYLWLARELGVELVTLDEKLAEAARA